MSTQLAFDTTLRDTGIKLSAEHAEEAHQGWGDKALDLLRRYNSNHFQSYTFTQWAYAMRLPEPPDGRAWGAVFVKARKLGIIKNIGYEKDCSPNSHGMPVRVWCKTNISQVA